MGDCREDPSTKPFLTGSKDILTDGDLKEECFIRLQQCKAPQLSSWHWAVHITLVLTYTIIFALSLQSLPKTTGPSTTYLKLPARSSVQQDIRYFSTAL